MTLLTLSAAWLAGVYLALVHDASASALGLFLLASVLLLLTLTVSLRRLSLVALLPVIVLLGTLRVATLGDDGASALVELHGPSTLVEGVVSSDPEPAGAATRFRLRVERIERDGLDGKWAEVSGELLVTMRESGDLVRARDRPYFRYGDRLSLQGTLEPPPELEGFDYPAYLDAQGIGSVMSFPRATLVDEGHGAPFYRWLYRTRRSISDSLALAVAEPQASLGQALLLGIRHNLPDDMVEDFRRTGASHVLAISGMHIAILLGITLAAGQWAFGRRHHLYLVLPLVAIWLYALISGLSPSAARAAVMGGVYLVALLLGRPRSVLPALAFAAAVMIAINPLVLRSVSFQLSFSAMVGIAFFAEPLSQWIRARYRDPGGSGGPVAYLLDPASYVVAMSIVATLATLPLVAFYFERVSLVGLTTTLLVLPALPVVLVAQAVTGLLGLLSTGLAAPFGWVAWLAGGYITGVVGLAARLPGAAVETGWASSAPVWLYYGLFALLGGLVTLRPTILRGLSAVPAQHATLARAGPGASAWLLALVVAVAALLWIAALSLPDGRLRVSFIDVGQGDAILITTPSGRQILVDGGPDPVQVAQFLGRKMSFRHRTVDLLVLTHPHQDHLNGLIEVLSRYEVPLVLERRTDDDSSSYLAWRGALEEEGANVVQAEPGQVIVLGDGVFIEVLSPPARLLRGTASDINNASVVLRLVYGDVSFLLSGDVFAEAESVLVSMGVSLASDVLKVAHHGSRSSSLASFLDRAKPTVAVISVGEENRFEHPHVETLEVLGRHVPEELLFLTSERGTVEFTTDGKRLEVKTKR